MKVGRDPPVPAGDVAYLYRTLDLMSSPLGNVAVRSLSALSNDVHVVVTIKVDRTTERKEDERGRGVITIATPRFRDADPSKLPVAIDTPPRLTTGEVTLP